MSSGADTPAEGVPVPSPEEVEAELVAAGVAEPTPAPGQERRYPSTIGGACYLGILAVVAVGFGIVATGHWRGGLELVAGALLVAAVLRLLLPAKDAGMLAVRHRLLDAPLLAAVGIALWVLASTIPDAPV